MLLLGEVEVELEYYLIDNNIYII